MWPWPCPPATSSPGLQLVRLLTSRPMRRPLKARTVRLTAHDGFRAGGVGELAQTNTEAPSGRAIRCAWIARRPRSWASANSG